MPERRLEARSALGGAAPLDETLAGVRIHEVTDRALAWVAARRGREPALRQAAREAFQVELPEPGWRTRGPVFTFAWIGPGQWLAEASRAQHDDIVAALQPVIGSSAALAEQTDAFCRLEVSGHGVPAAMEKLCPLDLAPDVFPAGAFHRTLIEHQAVHIGRLDAAPTFLLLAPRSSARSFLDALREAALGSTRSR